MAGRERPEHRHRLGAAALTDDDPVRVHPQRVRDEVLELIGGEAVDARGPGLVADAVGQDRGSCSSAEDSQTTTRSVPGISRPSAFSSVVLPEETRPATTMFLPGAHAGGEERSRLGAEEPELARALRGSWRRGGSGGSSRSGARSRRRRDRGGEPRAVGQPRLDARGDPVEALALDPLEQPFEEGAQLAVVGEADVGTRSIRSPLSRKTRWGR